MMMEAIKQDWKVIYHIDKKFITNEMIIEAVKQNSEPLEFIKIAEYDVKIVDNGVKTESGLQFIKDELKTNETLLKIYRNNNISLIFDNYNRGYYKKTLLEKYKSDDYTYKLYNNIETYKIMLDEVVKKREMQQNIKRSGNLIG
jgi:hypothetical protein